LRTDHLPAASAASRSGQAGVNLNNLRQLMIALSTYAEDSKGSLPHDEDASGIRWGGLLYHRDYLNDVNIFWSPQRETGNSVAYDFEGPTGMKRYILATGWVHVGYSANQDGAMPSPGATTLIPVAGIPIFPRRVHDVSINPSRLLVLTEAFYTTTYFATGSGQRDGRLHLNARSGSSLNNLVIFTWRGGKAARVYMDGHAAFGDSRSIGWTPNGPRDGVWKSYGSNFRVPEPWYEMR
jgi:hypothetical protein